VNIFQPSQDGRPALTSVIVNYYNPSRSPKSTAMLHFALEALAANTSSTLELILVDGSGATNVDLAEKCKLRNWRYLECPHKGVFAKIYNQGMQAAAGEYRVWMASDIFVPAGWDRVLISELRRTGAWMAAPYLTNSDYASQTYHWVIRMKTFYPSAMTFNLNMITSKCYQKVGLMDEQFSGCFNDTDYLIRIRKAGGEAIIANAGQVVHLSRGTPTAISTINGNEDAKKFLTKYPELASKFEDWQYDCVASIFCRSLLFRLFIGAAMCARTTAARARLVSLVNRFEPLLHKA
jgi:GT2 family glycosyltransferase